jgi:hypothetical protein
MNLSIRVLSRFEIAALLGTAGALLVMFLWMLSRTEGVFTYIQDDAYIHLQIARNLVENGSWGITPGLFESASSSPLWIIILALGYLLFGTSAFYLPLILNVALVFVLVFLMMRILQHFGITGWRMLLITLAVGIVTPLGPFAFGGMEHALHMVAVLLFVYALARVLTDDGMGRFYPLLFAVAPFVTALRYEGVFVIAPACLLLLLRRKWLSMFAVGTLGAFPPILFGVYSLSQGGALLPNTLLVKKNLSLSFLESLKALAGTAYLQIKTPLFTLFSAGMLLSIHHALRTYKTFWKPEIVALVVIGIAFVLQATFGRFSWVPMFRYEAYLIFVGLLFIFIALRTVPLSALFGKRPWSYLTLVTIVISLLFAMPLIRRAVSWPIAIQNARDIHYGTYSVAKFYSGYYGNKTVGVIDIGMLSFYGYDTETHVIDFWGLANNDVVAARTHGVYTADTMREIAKKEDLSAATLFDSWLGDTIPSEWPKVATWRLSGNVTLGNDTLTFYAPSCEKAAKLDEHLHAFSPELPEFVAQEFLPWRESCE